MLGALVAALGCRQAGAPCRTTQDCLDTEICVDKYCRKACNASTECESFEICSWGACLPRPEQPTPDAAVPDAAGADHALADRRLPDAAIDAAIDAAADAAIDAAADAGLQPPETEITFGPANPAETDYAIFEFGCDQQQCSFECRLDGADWRPCTSPRLYVSLPAGERQFEVRASNRAQQTDPTPAAHGWQVTTDHLVFAAAGFSHTCALNRSRVVKCWG
ncbi:MAG: hypothetical protein JXR83_13245, partial [Deltaproteobacteria bacterium]|nr:hypothetical protein [Deltaproteobacteria bacterium]